MLLRPRKAVAQERAAEHIDWVDATEVNAAWRTDGFVILQRYLSEMELAPALSELGIIFPTASGFHRARLSGNRRYAQGRKAASGMTTPRSDLLVSLRSASSERPLRRSSAKSPGTAFTKSSACRF